MKEFIFFIRKQSNSEQTLSTEKHQQFLKACETYIGDLKHKGKLISAQPIVWDGAIISKHYDLWLEENLDTNQEIIGGYYHILAKDLAEALQIAKANPEFTYNDGARIEVRPLKTKESSTGFVYPNK